MRKMVIKLTGSMLIIVAIFGLAISITGLINVWLVKPNLEDQLINGIDSVSETMVATDRLLSVVDSSLTNAKEDMALIEFAIDDMALSLEETKPIATSTARLVGEDLPSILGNLQQSLSSAEKSLKLVDDTLIVISSIPLLGARYAPEVPINQSVAAISQSLSSLPTSLESIESDLNTFESNLDQLQTDVYDLSDSISQMESSLDEAQAVVKEYQVILSTLQEKIPSIREEAPKTLNIIAWACSLLLIWMAMAQLGLLTQGFDLLNRKDT